MFCRRLGKSLLIFSVPRQKGEGAARWRGVGMERAKCLFITEGVISIRTRLPDIWRTFYIPPFFSVFFWKFVPRFSNTVINFSKNFGKFDYFLIIVNKFTVLRQIWPFFENTSKTFQSTYISVLVFPVVFRKLKKKFFFFFLL